MKAYAAQDFVDSIGVNIHSHYDPTPYAKSWDSIIKPRLLELGIKHIRDGAVTWAGWQRDWGVAHLKELGALGIKLNLLISAKSPWGDQTRFSELPKLAEHLGNVASFEGINDPDIQSWLKDWVGETQRLQTLLYATVAPLGIPVLAPSVVWSPNKLGDVSEVCDYGNMHCYAGGSQPAGPLDADLKSKSVCWPRLPPIVTECGYHNAVKSTGGHKPQTEAAAGTYAPILFLEHFRRCFPRSYWYELIDQHPDEGRTEPEKNFGLLRNDGTPKPAFAALKRLLALFSAEGTATPKDDAIALAGPDSLRSLLFTRADGVRLLSLWRNVKVGAAPETVKIVLPEPVTRYTLHPFSGEPREVRPTRSVSYVVWDAAQTFRIIDGAPQQLSSSLTPRHLSEEIPGTYELTVPLGAELVVIEFPPASGGGQ